MSIQIKMPDIGIDQAEVIEVLIQINDIVKKDQTLIVVEGQKASIEIPCPKNGVIKKVHLKKGDIVNLNTSIATLKKSKKTKNNLKKNFKNSEFKKQKVFQDIKKKNDTSVLVRSSPAIKRLCRKLNISLTKISGTGRKNRILKEDVEKYLSLTDNVFKKKLLEKDSCISKKKVNDNSKIKKKYLFLSQIQKFSNKCFSRNWTEVPHVTQFNKVDITKLEKFRTKINKNLRDQNIKFTLLTFIIKAVAINLLQFNKFNSFLHKKKDRLIINKNINIGIAVNTKDGILVPVIKNVDKKNIKDITQELIYLSQKSRNNKLTIDEMSNGSFTISNLGGFEIEEFTPIINCPEVAILGVSRAKIEPIWNKKIFVPRLLLPLSLSYDHRVINGVDGAIFMQYLNTNLSNFYKILF
ncbi:2-oxo acid dehydrogenase subunit E2 [Buchnera aphidicola]|uniref:2-oxo acid dehydrogenase subunit E2 n=1 Tax=Buchnera aphidicola TaxID=9 RepID=UPI002237A57E|nr:2-oxo acid dehydrogenase subunit E2 [Buchnera aphidicola]MCW5197766.1 2-oxo acid dehydrogenase subunit E2 [Buchnera aphidicola (Chaitophorus viminalis)]